jgi:HTH-like domain
LIRGRAERRALVERENSALAISQHCRLLAVSRSSVYRKPAEVSAEDLAIMALIDRHDLARPYYGSRRMAAWLATQGPVVNRKRVQRLMRLLWIWGRSALPTGCASPSPERARKAGKCSSPPTYPQAPQPTRDLMSMTSEVEPLHQPAL